VAGYVGQTYALTRPAGSGQDFGREAVDTLAKLMETIATSSR